MAVDEEVSIAPVEHVGGADELLAVLIGPDMYG